MKAVRKRRTSLKVIESAESTNRLARQLKIKKTPLTVAFQHLEPNWRSFMFYVDLAAKEGDKDMQKIMTAYGKLTKYEQLHFTSPEYLCELAQVQVRTLAGAVVPYLYDFGQFESTFVKSVYKPRVLARVATEALKKGPFHTKERELFLKITGDVPVARGNTTNIAAIGSTGSLVGKDQPGPLGLPSAGGEVLSMEAGDTEDDMNPDD